ncbi:MAG: DUF1232 domain-containing protein [Acidimicrobiia bacterium]|nr:DUF1232 domain-containing protein [Acidimicrobiia bacterium]
MIDSWFDDPGGLALVLIVVVALAMVIAAVFLFLKLLAKYRLVHQQFMPFGARAAFWLALGYAVLPIDVLPDPLLFDDIGVLIAALAYINHLRNQLQGGADGGSSGPDRRGPIIDVDEL